MDGYSIDSLNELHDKWLADRTIDWLTDPQADSWVTVWLLDSPADWLTSGPILSEWPVDCSADCLND
jgi:hypothetical protein